MPARFRAMIANLGFDDSSNPWLMVPAGGSNFVLLDGTDRCTLESTAPTVATVAEGVRIGSARMIVVHGRRKGVAHIRVLDGTREVARLEVGVKSRKLVKVSFNFVKDSARHKTSRDPSQTSGWITLMNSILTPQANVKIQQQSARWVTVNQNLGDVVRFSKHLTGVSARQHEWDVVVAKGDGAADFNIFFVWEYEQDITPRTDHTDAGTLGANCIFEDDAGRQVGETLAHETGHFLGCDDTYTSGTVKNLMYGITDTRGRHITKAHANIMNP